LSKLQQSFFEFLDAKREQKQIVEIDDSRVEIARNAKQMSILSADVVEAHGKSVDALAYSRALRGEILEYFDYELPQSVMTRKVRNSETDCAHGSYEDSAKYEGAFSISCQGAANGALSIFPQNIGRAIVKLYTKPEDVVVDPFAGHNSRMELCVKAGRSYIGFDRSARFMRSNREEAEKLRDENPGLTICLYETDSRRMCEHIPREVGDFTITSPPYYDIEDYGDEPEQLGKAKTYNAFLEEMQKVICANFECLKRGAFCAYFINDFRRNKKFHAYHIDTYNMLLKAGFEAWDMLIVDFGSSFRAAFAQQIIETKILPKRHEYAVIVRKPI